MRKKIGRKVLCGLLVGVLLLPFTNLVNNFSLDYVKAETSETAQKHYSQATIEDDFDDRNVIVTVDGGNSQFKGINSSVEKRIREAVEIAEIENLTAFSDELLDADGDLDEDKAPSLAAHYEKVTFNQILRLELKETGKEKVLAAVKKLEKLDGIFSAEPNMLYTSASVEPFTPNDTYYEEQWGLYGEHGIHADEAWTITKGQKSVRVGIIDSGVEEHPDLIANVDYNLGYDYVNSESDTTDDLADHGTSVAGIIGAVGNNERGVSGVAQNVTMIPMQILEGISGVSEDAILLAISSAINCWENINRRISVINYSISGFGIGSEENYNLLEQIENFPGLFVWSGGNLGENVDNYATVLDFKLSNIISVGAINSMGDRAYFSNYGTNIDVYAPGEDVYSTSINSGYRDRSGCSFAAPHVSGVAALALSLNSKLTGAELKTLILNNADTGTISTPDGTTQTVKKLNAYKVVSSMPLYETEEVDGGCVITQVNYDGSAELVVPATIDGLDVVGIGDYAFSDCEYVTSVVLPYTVTSLGEYVFRNCYALEKVDFETDSLLEISSDTYALFYGCDSLEQVIMTDSYLVALYREDMNWNSVWLKLHIRHYALDLSDWTILTNAATDNFEVLNLVDFYGMSVTYFTPTLTENNMLSFAQIENLTVNTCNHYVIYLTDYIPYDINVLAEWRGGIGDFILVNGGYVDAGEASVIRDSYSLGFNIATEYLAQNESVPNFEEVFGYFPVIAPNHYKNDTLFLKGMSDVFGYLVDVISTATEFASIKQSVDELGLEFDEWLFVEFELITAGEEELSFLEFFATEDVATSNFYFFSWNTAWLTQNGITDAQTYRVLDKCSLLEGIVPALIQNDTTNFEYWYFNPVERWIELRQAANMEEVPLETWHEQWLEYWEQRGYTVNETQWAEYWALRWTISGEEIFYIGVSDWDSYYELTKKIEMEQIVVREIV